MGQDFDINTFETQHLPFQVQNDIVATQIRRDTLDNMPLKVGRERTGASESC